MTHVKALDGVRGLAVLLVIFFHFGYLELGWTGVQLFFVLSGFLITSVLLKELDAPLGSYLNRFYWRRGLRIFPLYFAYLTAVAAVFALTGQPRPFGSQWPALFTYTFNYVHARPGYIHSIALNHFWSLSVEEQFYLFWPLFLYLLPQRRRALVIGALLVLSPIARALTVEYGIPYQSLTWSQLDAFAAGALVAVAQPTRMAGRVTPVLLSVIVTAGAGIVNTCLSKHRFTVDTSLGYPIAMIRNGQHIWGYSLVNVCAATLIVACLGQNWLARVFQMRPLAYTGKISYGLYVYHPVMQLFVTSVLPGEARSVKGVLTFCIYFCLLFALAHLSFTGFESRLIALKDRHFRISAPASALSRFV